MVAVVSRRVVRVALCMALTLAMGCSSPTPGAGAPSTAAPEVPEAPQVRVPVDLPIQIGLAYGNTLVEMNDRGLAAALDDAVDIGVAVIRVDLDWATIQLNSRDEYDWRLFDRIVRAAEARGLRLQPVLAYTPYWARDEDCESHMCAPADTGEFAEFAGAAASRYAPHVLGWEIWNEPNDSGFWSPVADPARYTDLLQAASLAIRRIDPEALIVLGGLASIDTDEDGDLSPADFLARVCELGGNTAISAVGFHPYTYPRLPSSYRTDSSSWSLIQDRPDSLRSILSRYGTPHVPIWLTEYGAPTGGPGTASDSGPDTSGGTTHVTEDRQADIARDVLHLVANEGDVQAMMWYSWRDLSDEQASNLSFYGLRRSDGSAKPARQVFKSTLAELGLARG